MHIDALRKVPLFAHLSDDQLQCVVEHGTDVWLELGTQIAHQGDSPDGFYIILEGQTEWTRNVGGETVPVIILQAGDVFAELILILDEPYPTSGRALTAVHLYKLAPDEFWRMLELCPGVMRQIMKVAAQRSQIHETVTQQQAKLISLGTLSAGLAHELNNPAAAVRRQVQHLEDILQKLPSLALQLHRQPISETQLNFLSNLYQQSALTTRKSQSHDPLIQSEFEDAVSDWLEEHKIERGWTLAPMLVTAGLMVDKLDEITAQVAPECLESVLTWLEATISGIKLLEEINLSSTRISELIKSMKDYSYMDQAALQEIDIHEGIESTLTILKHKLKYGIVINREYGELPSIWAYGQELNQAWTNLIDNAIDAMQGIGELTIRTHRDCEQVVIEISDTGPGVPLEIQSHIFEPFFTTKGVGAGTGLGLDIARRIVVQRHQGEICFDSKSGETHFRVRLPIAQT
ncbi:MAG TPA: ATP-binding protein [Candidatus Sericytochromatia bacterium]